MRQLSVSIAGNACASAIRMRYLTGGQWFRFVPFTGTRPGIFSNRPKTGKKTNDLGVRVDSDLQRCDDFSDNLGNSRSRNEIKGNSPNGQEFRNEKEVG